MPKTSEQRLYRSGPMRTVWPSPSKPARRRAARRADADYGKPGEPSWREVDWPAHTHQVRIRDGAVNYVDLGDGGRAVIFVHGLGGGWQNWLENLPAIAAAGYRAIALDLPGFGRSNMPSDPITITRLARTVDELCGELGLDTVSIVGNSMGGFTAAEAAIRHPARIDRLVLVDAAGISSALGRNWLSERVGRFLVTGAIGGAAPRDREKALKLMARPGLVQIGMGAVARHPTLLARDLVAEQLTSVGAPGFMPALEAIIAYDFTDRLSEITCPALVVQGDQDVLVPIGDAHEFAARIPDAATLILHDTGHVPMLERPATFNRALIEFLGQDDAREDADPATEPLLAEAQADAGLA